MKFMAKKLYPHHEDEAFMVGIFESIKKELGDELKNILIKVGVPDTVIQGLYNSKSVLGKLKELVTKLSPFCEKLLKEDDSLDYLKLPQDLKSLFIKSCIDAENTVNQLISLL